MPAPQPRRSRPRPGTPPSTRLLDPGARRCGPPAVGPDRREVVARRWRRRTGRPLRQRPSSAPGQRLGAAHRAGPPARAGGHERWRPTTKVTRSSSVWRVGSWSSPASPCRCGRRPRVPSRRGFGTADRGRVGDEVGPAVLRSAAQGRWATRSSRARRTLATSPVSTCASAATVVPHGRRRRADTRIRVVASFAGWPSRPGPWLPSR